MNRADRGRHAGPGVVIALALLAVVVLSACGERTPARTTRSGQPPLIVAAASDLSRMLQAAQPAIEQACGRSINVTPGSSGQFAEQVRAGASFDVFLSADKSYIDDVERAGLIVPGTSVSYAVGRLALAWRSGGTPLASLVDLTRSDIQHIAIANPEHAPYGRIARDALTAAGVWDRVNAKVVYGETVRQATDYVGSGNAEAGVIALALVEGTAIPHTMIDASLYQPLLQAGAVPRAAAAGEAGRCVLDYLRSDAGTRTLAMYGFGVPPR